MTLPLTPSGLDPGTSLRLPVTERGQSGSARRSAAWWAEERRLAPELADRIALVVSELAANLERHTTQGGLILLRQCGPAAVSVLSLDRGPGVENFARCLRDGYSTGGTAGIGLGGVQRLSRRFDAHSQPGSGTVLHAEVSLTGPSDGIGAVSVPHPGESTCGDTWALQRGPGWLRLFVADGLGHGPLAAEAARAAREVFLAGAGLDLVELLRRMDQRLRPTRGAAATLVHVDATTGRLSHAGVGNISAVLVSPERASHLVGQNGTVGAAMPTRPRQLEHTWTPEQHLVIHSDGLRTHWHLTAHAGVLRRSPEMIAGLLFRDYQRTSDDSTVLVVPFPGDA